MEILVNINKKIAKRGGNSLDIETLLESAEVKSIPSPKMSVKLTFDVTSFDRAFVKMALGLAHFVIGEKYSRCHEADLLREFLWEPDKDKRGSFPLHGQVWPNADPKLTNVFKYKDFHVLALLNVNPFGFYGLLFGQYCGHIQCSENSEYFAEEVPLGDGWVFLIDPVSRKLRKYGLAEYFNKKQCNALRIAD